MTSGLVLKPLTSTVALALLLVLPAGCAEPPRPKNVLLLSVDTLRADALGFAGYGAARTPVADRLAAEGTVFTQAISPMPRTTPALGSLMTGLWPQNHGSREVGDPIGEMPTLAEILARHGLATLGVSANSTAGPREGLGRGFRELVTYEELVETYGDGLYRDLTDVTPDKIGWAGAVTHEALRLVAALGEDEPYFLWLFYFDPHLMYRPPAPWQDVEAGRCWELYEHFTRHPGDVGQVFADVGGVASRALEACRRLYDAEVAYVDHEIGRLLEELDAAGRLEETLIVFTADHGENFGEGGLFFEHGENAHDAGLRVPLVFHGPGVARGRRDDAVVSLVDVLPTVLALAGVTDEPPPSDGLDLSPRLGPEGAAPSRQRVVFAESATAFWNEAVRQVTTGRAGSRVCIHGERFTLCEEPGGATRLYDHLADPTLSSDVAAEHPEAVEALREAWKSWPPESARQRTARSDRFKLVQLPLLEGGYEARLYDLQADPAESVDVAAEHPEVHRHLLGRLEAWSAGIKAGVERPFDPEREARLRALGYLK